LSAYSGAQMADFESFLKKLDVSDINVEAYRPHESGKSPEEIQEARDHIYNLGRYNAGAPRMLDAMPGAEQRRANEELGQRRQRGALEQELLLFEATEGVDWRGRPKKDYEYGPANLMKAKWEDVWGHWEGVKHFLYENDDPDSINHPPLEWTDEQVKRITDTVPEDMWDHFFNSYSSKDLERKYVALEAKQQLDTLWAYYYDRPEEVAGEGFAKWWANWGAAWFDPAMLAPYMAGGLGAAKIIGKMGTGAYTAARVASVGQKNMQMIKRASLLLPGMGVGAAIDSTIGGTMGYLMQQDNPLFTNKDYVKYVLWAGLFGTVFGAWEGWQVINAGGIMKQLGRPRKQPSGPNKGKWSWEGREWKDVRRIGANNKLLFAEKNRADFTTFLGERYGGNTKMLRMLSWFDRLAVGEQKVILEAAEAGTAESWVRTIDDAILNTDPGPHGFGQEGVDFPRVPDDVARRSDRELLLPKGEQQRDAQGRFIKRTEETLPLPWDKDPVTPLDPMYAEVLPGGAEQAAQGVRRLDALEHFYEMHRLREVNNELQAKDIIDRNTKFDNIVEGDQEILKKHGVTVLDDMLDGLQKGELGSTPDMHATALNKIFDGKAQNLEKEEILDLLRWMQGMSEEELKTLGLSDVLRQNQLNRTKLRERMEATQEELTVQLEQGRLLDKFVGDTVYGPEGRGIITAIAEDGTLTVQPLSGTQPLREKLHAARVELVKLRDRINRIKTGEPEPDVKPSKPGERWDHPRRDAVRVKLEKKGIVLTQVVKGKVREYHTPDGHVITKRGKYYVITDRDGNVVKYGERVQEWPGLKVAAEYWDKNLKGKAPVEAPAAPAAPAAPVTPGRVTVKKRDYAHLYEIHIDGKPVRDASGQPRVSDEGGEPWTKKEAWNKAEQLQELANRKAAKETEAATEAAKKKADLPEELREDVPTREDPSHWAAPLVKGILKDSGELMQGTYIWLTPDEFLAISRSGEKWKPDLEKLARLRKSLIDEGKPLAEAPRILLRNAAKAEHVRALGHEGRHRALVLKEMGHETIPVKVELRGTRHKGDKGAQFNAELERLASMKIEDAVKDPAFPKYIINEYGTGDPIPFIIRHRRIAPSKGKATGQPIKYRPEELRDIPETPELVKLEAELERMEIEGNVLRAQYEDALKESPAFQMDMANAIKYDFDARYRPPAMEPATGKGAMKGDVQVLYTGRILGRRVEIRRMIRDRGKPHDWRVTWKDNSGHDAVFHTQREINKNVKFDKDYRKPAEEFNLEGLSYEDAIPVIEKRIRQHLLDDIDNTIRYENNVEQFNPFAADGAPRRWLDDLNTKGVVPKELTDHFGDFSLRIFNDILDDPLTNPEVRRATMTARENIINGTAGEGGEGGGNMDLSGPEFENAPHYTKFQKWMSGFFSYRHRPIFQDGPDAVRQLAFDVLGGWVAPYDRHGRPVVGGGSAESVLSGGSVNFRRFETHKLLNTAAREWKAAKTDFIRAMRGNGHGANKLEEIYHRLHKRYVETRHSPEDMSWETGIQEMPLSKEAQQAIERGGDATIEHFERMRQWGIDHGVEELAKTPANKAYFPKLKNIYEMEKIVAARHHSTLKNPDGSALTGKDQLEHLIHLGLMKGQPDAAAKENGPEALKILAQKMMQYYLDVSSHNALLDSILGVRHTKIETVINLLDDALRTGRSKKGIKEGDPDPGFTSEQKEMLIDVLTVATGEQAKKGQEVARLMHRIKMDHSVSMMIDRGLGAGQEKIFLSELFLTDTMQVAGRYTMEIITQAQTNAILKRYTTSTFKPASLKELEAHIVDRLEQLGYKRSEIKYDLDLLFKYIRNDPKFERGVLSSILATGQQGATMMKLPAFTRSGTPEWLMARTSQGIITHLIENIPFLGRLISDARGGRAHKETVWDFLHGDIGGGRTEGIISDQWGSWQLAHEGDPLLSGGFATAHARFSRGTHWVSRKSFYRGLNENADFWATRNFLDIFVRAAKGHKKALRRFSDVRIAQLGLTREEVNSILEELAKEGVVTKQTIGKFGSDYTIQWDQMDDVIRARLTGGARKNLSQVVQRSSSADLPYSMITSGMASLLTQFRAFGISSQANHFARNIQAHDAQTFSNVMSMALGGVLVHYSKTVSKFWDDPKRMREEMAPDRIAAGAMLYSGFMGMLPDVIDTMLYYGSGMHIDPFFSPSDKPMMFRIPLTDVVRGEYMGMSALANSLLEGRVNKQRYYQMKNALPGANIFYIEWLLDLYRGEFPKR